MGDIPLAASVVDWMCMEGDLSFLWLRTSGGCQHLRVPLDVTLNASIYSHRSGGETSVYRKRKGHLTPVGKFVALFCLEKGVPVPAISQQLGVSESVVRWLRRKRWRAGKAPNRVDNLALLRYLAFEPDEG